MKKRETIFLEALMLSLTVIFVSTMMADWTHTSVFGMSSSEKICLEQSRENQEFCDCAGQNLALTSIALKFGSIRNTIEANAKTSNWLTWIFPVEPKSITAQILLQSLPRASPS